MFTCLIDVDNNQISLEGETDAKNLFVGFVIDSKQHEKLNLKNISFGYQLKNDKGVVLESSWPIFGMRFGIQKPGQITSVSEKININTDYTLLVWYEDGIHRETAVEKFNSGLPFKEYESMVWNEKREDWDMLKPYPEVEGDEPIRYFWNEEILDWEEDVEYREFFSKEAEARKAAEKAAAEGKEELLTGGVDFYLENEGVVDQNAN